MDLFAAFIYGLIQGLTEFLPVSSSGHLALLPSFMKIDDPGVTFDLMMHVGTALAVMLYFYKDLLREFRHIIPATFKWKDQRVEYLFFRNLLVSMFATFALVILIKDVAEIYGRSPIFIAINLAVFGVLMYVADRPKKSDGQFDMQNSFSFKGALIIGISQALAVFPGVSRSGITITATRFLGVSREQGLRYSFLLSLPIIFAGAIFKLAELTPADSFSWGICLSGISFSFFIGLAAIHFLMRVVTRIGFLPFAIYRVSLAAVLFYMFF